MIKYILDKKTTFLVCWLSYFLYAFRSWFSILFIWASSKYHAQSFDRKYYEEKYNINYWVLSVILLKSQLSIVFYRLLIIMLHIFVPTYIVLLNAILISLFYKEIDHKNCIYVWYVFVGKKGIIFQMEWYVWQLRFRNSKYVVF